jgi:hypothetical protein
MRSGELLSTVDVLVSGMEFFLIAISRDSVNGFVDANFSPA